MKWVRHMADYSQKEKELEREHLEKLVKEEDRSIKPMKEFESPEDLYHELIASVRKYHPSADISLIEKAYHVARDAHEGQTRKSGEPYIVHPLCVAIILAELELDKETIAAGLLHDVLEDTVMTADEIKEEFSEEVLLLVDGGTKLLLLFRKLSARRRICNFCLILQLDLDVKNVLHPVCKLCHTLRLFSAERS